MRFASATAKTRIGPWQRLARTPVLGGALPQPEAAHAARASAGAGLAIALAAVAFGAQGGSDLARTTVVEIALALASGVLVSLAILRGRRGPAHGALSLALFAALAVVTIFSVAWSVAPEISWIEANRTLVHLLVFAAGIALARLGAATSEVVLPGFLAAAGLILAYALTSRVFPATLAGEEYYARIGQPFDYWNAVGAIAALAMPLALWLGARRGGHRVARALAYPLTGMCVTALFLTYSRGALAAALVGVGLWLAFVPLRLRSLAVLAVSLVVSAPVIAWALSQEAFTTDDVALAVRQSVAAEWGLLLVVMVATLLGLGLLTDRLARRRPPSELARRRVGLALAIAAAALPLAVVGKIALSEPGLSGTVSAQVDQLTSETSKTSGGPQRLTQSSSTRGRYWRQAGAVYDDHPITGAGAGAYATARLRVRKDDTPTRHAHGYVAQTLADLGIPGLAASLALTLAWLAAAARATGLHPRLRRRGPGRDRRREPFDAERAGVIALALAVVVFAVQSAIDWTWFIPGTAVTAILAAGLVAGRRPLTVPAAAGGEDAASGEPGATPDGEAAGPGVEAAGLGVEGAEHGADPPSETSPPETTLVHPDGGDPGRRTRWRAPASLSRLARALPPPRPVAAAAALVAALLCAWAVWQPARSDAASAEALELVDAHHLEEAGARAEWAGEVNPLSPKPLLAEAAVRDAGGDRLGALHILERAVINFRGDPQVWLRLASYQLRDMKRPQEALETLRGALFLDPRSKPGQALFIEARMLLRTYQLALQPPPGPTAGAPPPTRTAPPGSVPAGGTAFAPGQIPSFGKLPSPAAGGRPAPKRSAPSEGDNGGRARADDRPRASRDEDGDGLTNAAERRGGTSPRDRDSDDDGLGDGAEAERLGTGPDQFDSDGDGLGDGLELGRSTGVADPPGPVAGTGARFRPDRDPSTKTDPLDGDTDGDGKADGEEDRNGNGRRDEGESNPLVGRG